MKTGSKKSLSVAARKSNGPQSATPPELPDDLAALNSQRAETARYIAAMSNEMAAMANNAGLKLVAHFLAMAQAEAEGAAGRAA